MKNTKIIFTALALLAMPVLLFAYDWPQPESETNTVKSQFGQLRGSTISSSMIFSEKQEVKSCDKGKSIAVISEHEDDFGWFESPLGTAIIVEHGDKLCTVYANLDRNTITDYQDVFTVSAGETLGTSGQSAWHNEGDYLEFKVFDTKSHTAVNPKILMPKSGREKVLDAGEITLEDKNGNKRNLLVERKIPSGTYFVYRKRNEIEMPFQTLIAVNGNTTEKISYETMTEKNGRLSIRGNSFYSSKDLYPDSVKQLLGTVQFNKGQNTLSITMVNLLGNQAAISYKLDIY